MEEKLAADFSVGEEKRYMYWIESFTLNMNSNEIVESKNWTYSL